jgi:hypothetical protein
MQLGVGSIVFPSWTAAVTLVKEHGTSAVQHAAAAVRAGDGGTRLDEAVRAMTSFDHSVDNARKLPVQLLVRSAGKYFRGYEIARQAVNLLVASGLIPGAKERVGRQSLVAAKETFLAGVDAAATTRGRYRRYLSDGWLQATSEDALSGVALLGTGAGVGRDLLAGIAQVRGAVQRGAVVDPRLAQAVGALFDQAGAQLLAREQAAGAAAPTQAVDGAAFARAGELLAQVERTARDMVVDADEMARRIEARA